MILYFRNRKMAKLNTENRKSLRNMLPETLEANGNALSLADPGRGSARDADAPPGCNFFYFYRPQQLREVNVFTSLFQEFCPRVGRVCVYPMHTPPGMHAPWTCTPPGHTPLGMHPPGHAHSPWWILREMQSMSEQYASYWNAFLSCSFQEKRLNNSFYAHLRSRGHIKGSKGALQIFLWLMVLCENGHFSQILHFCLHFGYDFKGLKMS